MIKQIISSILTIKTNDAWYKSFVKQAEEREKTIPKYELEQRHINNLKVILNRDELLKLLPKEAICAEIGVDQGDFSEDILKFTKPKKLHLIDAWGDESRYSNTLRDNVKIKFKTEINEGKIDINIGLSTTILKEFKDDYFDWVYLDTDHTYNTTFNELSILKNKVKNGGIIAGHDFTTGNWCAAFRYGVIEAVHEFCVKYDWELILITCEIHHHRSFALRKIN